MTRRIIVRGRVQGVSYRWWTSDEARALGLAGWVRNRRDGSVEIVARGSAEQLDRLAERCRSGPPAARVTEVEVADADEEVTEGFEQRPTI